MQLRPLLATVYAREREAFLPSELEESLLDTETEGQPESHVHGPLWRAYLVDTAIALLEDAVVRLRRKSHAAAELEATLPSSSSSPSSGSASWATREASWSVPAVERAMTMPREGRRVPDDVYWGAALIDACETAVAAGAARRLVGAAVLDRLAKHEALLDASIAQLRAAAQAAPPGKQQKRKQAPTETHLPQLPAARILDSLREQPQASADELLRALQEGTLGYAPPDARRLDAQMVAEARGVLVRNLAALAAPATTPTETLLRAAGGGSGTNVSELLRSPDPTAPVPKSPYNAQSAGLRNPRLQEMLSFAAAPAAPASAAPAAPASAAPAAPASAAPAAPASAAPAAPAPAAPAAPAPAAPAAPAPAAPAAPAPAAPAAPAGAAGSSGDPRSVAAPASTAPASSEVMDLANAVA
jgi:hypothetical protein